MNLESFYSISGALISGHIESNGLSPFTQHYAHFIYENGTAIYGPHGQGKQNDWKFSVNATTSNVPNYLS